MGISTVRMMGSGAALKAGICRGTRRPHPRCAWDLVGSVRRGVGFGAAWCGIRCGVVWDSVRRGVGFGTAARHLR